MERRLRWHHPARRRQSPRHRWNTVRAEGNIQPIQREELNRRDRDSRSAHRHGLPRRRLRGILLRSGGTVQDNFLAQNAVANQVGNTASVVTGNVITQGVDLPSLASGVGIDVAFSIPSVDIENNIIAHDQSAYTYNLSAINLNGGTRNATVKTNIVYDWRRTFINGAASGTNTVQNNTFEDFDGYHPLVK